MITEILVMLSVGVANFKNVFISFQFRGAVFLVMAVLGLLLFDHDDLRAHINEHRILYTLAPFSWHFLWMLYIPHSV